jgi:hypothetical protein
MPTSDILSQSTLTALARDLNTNNTRFNAIKTDYTGLIASISTLSNKTTISETDKSTINSNIASIQQYIDELTTTNTNLKTTYIDPFINSGIYDKKYTIDAKQNQLENKREIAKLREAQTEILENREAANFHTSWMGMPRPLKEQSRTGLFVAAIAFLLVGVIIVVILLQNSYTGSSAVPDFLSFSGFKGIGGRRIRK